MYTWQHTDPDLQAAAAAGVVRALSGDWTSGTEAERGRDYRALLVDSCHAAARFAGQVYTRAGMTGMELCISPDPSPNAAPERRWAAEVINRTWGIFEADAFGASELPPGVGITTFGGVDGTVDTAALPVAVVVIVAVVGVVGIAYCSSEAAKVVDRQLARKHALRVLMASQAQALQVVDLHQTREQQAGKALPLDAASKRVLSDLARIQQQVTPQPLGDLTTPPDEIAKRLGTGTGIGLGLAVPLVALFAAAWFSNGVK